MSGDVARERARWYRSRTGRERPDDGYPPAFTEAWRAACRAAGETGSWTHIPSGSAVAAMRGLAELGPSGGTELARGVGMWQGNLTSRTLPRLEALGIVSSTAGVPVRRGARIPLVWTLTDRGRDLVALLP